MFAVLPRRRWERSGTLGRQRSPAAAPLPGLGGTVGTRGARSPPRPGGRSPRPPFCGQQVARPAVALGETNKQ